MKIIIFALAFILIFTLSQQQQIAGGWTQHQDLQVNNELITEGLIQINQNTKLKVKQVLDYQTQVVAGTNHKITLSVTDEKGQDHLLHLKIYQNLQGKLEVTQHFLIFGKGSIFQKLKSAEEQKKLYQYVRNYISFEDSKIAQENFIFSNQNPTQFKGTLYVVGLDIQKLSTNRDKRYEQWVYENEEGILSPIFSKVTMDTITSIVSQTAQKMEGQCSDISSFFLCSLRSDCKTSSFAKNGTCSNKNEDL